MTEVMLDVTDVLQTASTEKQKLREKINQLELFMTANKRKFESVSQELICSEAKIKTMQNDLYEAEKKAEKIRTSERSLQSENKQMKDDIVVLREREQQLIGEICKLRNEKHSDKMMTTTHGLQREQNKLRKRVEYLTGQLAMFQEKVGNLTTENESAKKELLHVSHEAEIQIKQLQQLLKKQNDELNIALKQLSDETMHSQNLHKQVQEAKKEMRLQQTYEAQHRRKSTEELKYFQKLLQQNIDDAEDRIKTHLTHVQQLVKNKENTLLDRINKAEAEVREVKNRQVSVDISENKFTKMLIEQATLQQTYKLQLDEVMQKNIFFEAQKRQYEDSLHDIKQQIQSLRDEATKREVLINYLQQKKKEVCNDNESTDKEHKHLRSRIKEANIQVKQMQQRLISDHLKYDADSAELQTHVDDLKQKLHKKINEADNTLIELSSTEKKLQELEEELCNTTQKLRLEKEGRKEDNIKYKKDIESVCNKFQVEIEAAVMSISMKLIKTQEDFTFKENELLDKISKTETKIQKLNNISNKYQETRHELETTNQQHEEYIKSMNEREQSIEQLQGEISEIQNDNINLKKTVKELTSNLAIASEENIKLQEETESWKQQLEKVKVHANTDVVEKERQLELRIEEQRNSHLEEVKQIHLKYKDSMKLISDANSRERRAVDSVKVLEGKLKSLEDTISDMKDEYEQQKQELFKNVSVSLNTIKDLQTRLNNTQASERNLNKRLKERDQELERLNAFSKGKDSERRRFEAKIAANENQLQQANEQLEHFNKERQNLKQELYQEKSSIRLEKEGRKEDNIKHKKDTEAVCNKFQVEIEAAVMSISMKLIKTQDDFTFKENELLDKISKAETKIQKLNNISNKYQETRHELETTNQQHEEYIKSMNEREQSIEQLHEEISEIQNDNRNLKKTVKELISNLAIASEENIKLQEETESWKQQLEKVKVHANTDVVEKERQLELRIEEQRNSHLEEVKHIHLKYKDNMKLISDANSRERRAIDSVKVLEGKLKSLEDTISDMKDEYEQQKQELFKNVSVSLNTIKDLQTRLNNAQASERNLNKRLKERDQELERLNAFSKGQDSERRRFEAKIAANENQLQQANEQLEHFNKERQNLKQELDQEKSRLEELVKNYQTSVNDRIKSKDDDSLLRQLDQLKSKDKELATEIIQVRQQLKSSNIELEETKTRLSKLMGQRLTDNNPNITDLSDKNRPTKLAERYSELYDNEWTDAFENLDKIYKDEQKTITILIIILTEAATFCRKEAHVQMENLRKVLNLETTLSESRGQDVPDVINKQLKDSRKTVSERAGKNLEETYIKRLQQLTSASARDALRVETFLREAFSLCWLMSIQDPPVVFDRMLQHGEKFNTELYRSYTKAGPLVDYPVWPTMFLHEGGPVLYKGVAQGCNK